MPISEDVIHQRYEHGHRATTTTHVVREALVRFHVNGEELATFMCTPSELDLLAVGFLRSEGIIDSMADVRRVVVCPSGACVEVWLRDANRALPTAKILTSGCGGGITFNDLTAEAEPLASATVATPAQLSRLMFALQQSHQTRGSHTAALAEGDNLLVTATDVGRHNTIDKLWGRCMIEGIPTEGRILLSTGRISSEMLGKAARMRAPIVASRTSPTTLSLALAAAWNVTLVGYVRRDSLNVYTGAARIMEER